jgi:hypothetical protein
MQWGKFSIRSLGLLQLLFCPLLDAYPNRGEAPRIVFRCINLSTSRSTSLSVFGVPSLQ